MKRNSIPLEKDIIILTQTLYELQDAFLGEIASQTNGKSSILHSLDDHPG